MGLRTESSKCQEHGLEAQENVLEKRELRDHRMELAGQRCAVSHAQQALTSRGGGETRALRDKLS